MLAEKWQTFIQAMTGHNNSCSVLTAQVFQKKHYPVPIDFIKPLGGFVQNQQGRLFYQRAGNKNQALFTIAELLVWG